MAIAFRNNSSTRSFSNSWNISRPSGTATGDVLVLWGWHPEGAVGWSTNWHQSYSGWTSTANAVINDNGTQVWMFCVWKKVTNIGSEPSTYTINNHDGISQYGSFYMAAFSGSATNATVTEANTYAALDSIGLYGAFNNAAGGGYMATTSCGMRTSTTTNMSPTNGWTQQYYAPAGGFGYGTFMHTWKQLTSGAISSWEAQTNANGAISSITVVIGPAANVAPGAATLTSPPNSSTLDRTATQRFSFTHNDEAWDGQSGYEIQYRVVGAGSWSTTGTVASTNGYHDFAGGTFSAADYEWQARTRDQSNAFGPWSSSRFFTAVNPPAGPSITSPINGGTVDTNHDVTWSIGTQQSYQVRTVADNAGVADTGTVYYDSGEVVQTATRLHNVSFPTNQRWEHVQVRIKDSGLWSSWISVRVFVSYTPPPVPFVQITAQQADATLTVAVTNPTPGGGQPAVLSNEVWVDDGDGPVRVSNNVSPNGSFVYHTPVHGRVYDMTNTYAVAVGDNGSTIPSTTTVQQVTETNTAQTVTEA